jgi:beta-galactosidase
MAGTARTWLHCTAIILGLVVVNPCQAAERQQIGLDGEWEFRLDAQNVGISEHWFEERSQFSGTIQVPGAWEAQGYGERAGILRHQYAGAAWYRRKVAVPSSWSGKVVNLRIGGAHRLTRIFVNGVDFGEHNGFNAPFGFDVTSAIRAGAENVIAIRVENPAFNIETSPGEQIPTYPVGMLDYIANWGGIYGGVTLEAENRTRIESVRILSDTDKRLATFQIKLATDGASGLSVRIGIPNTAPVEHEAVADRNGEAEASVEVPLPKAPLWSPDHPNLLTAKIQLLRGENEVDEVDERFGFRQVTTRGNMLLLNGDPLYLRAYGDDDVEVLNGFPPASPQICLERMRLVKSFGFNAVRFHSMTPPECYFDAADQTGILIMAELPAAYTQYFFAHRDFLRGALERTLMAYRNHPSLLSLAFGNEFNLRWLKTDADRQEMTASIAEFYRLAKQIAPSTLIMSNDGFDLRPTDMVSLSGAPPPDRPTIRHEFGDYYCSLPNPGLIDQFTGAMIPEWLGRKKQWIEANHLEDIYPKYLQNSIRLQQLGRKFQIEKVRADASVTGYDYWLLVDYPGGTGEGDSWEEGWFDSFWHPKVPPDEGRELNSPLLTMISAGVGQRTLWAGGRKHISLRISNYGEEPIENGTILWTLTSNGSRVDGGEIHGVELPLGDVGDAGQIILHAPEADHPRKLELAVTVMDGAARYRNRWEFWAFPKKNLLAEAPALIELKGEWPELRRVYPWLGTGTDHATPKALLITESLSEEAIADLKRGGRVLLIMKQQPSEHGIGFFPAAGGAMGTLIPDSAAMGDFPNEGFADLQFYSLLDGASPIPLDTWPTELNPILGAIRTTSAFLSEQKGLSRAGYIFQVRMGTGKLLVTSPGVWNHYDDLHPEGIYLFDRLLRYACSDDFVPQVEISNALLESLQAR